jgi:CrcB protein
MYMNSLALIYVACGGAFGSMLRYVASDALARFNNTSFPYGTLSVNILGSLLMGAWIAAVLVMPTLAKAKDLHLLIAVGVLGGFTTFSTFSLEMFLLAERGLYAQAIFYVAASVLLSFAALLFGIVLVKWMVV